MHQGIRAGSPFSVFRNIREVTIQGGTFVEDRFVDVVTNTHSVVWVNFPRLHEHREKVATLLSTLEETASRSVTEGEVALEAAFGDVKVRCFLLNRTRDPTRARHTQTPFVQKNPINSRSIVVQCSNLSNKNKYGLNCFFITFLIGKRVHD